MYRFVPAIAHALVPSQPLSPSKLHSVTGRTLSPRPRCGAVEAKAQWLAFRRVSAASCKGVYVAGRSAPEARQRCPSHNASIWAGMRNDSDVLRIFHCAFRCRCPPRMENKACRKSYAMEACGVCTAEYVGAPTGEGNRTRPLARLCRPHAFTATAACA